jgi:arylsulfatase A-like enzyme
VNWLRVHDVVFALTFLAAAAHLGVVAVGAQVRERQRLVEALEPDPVALAADRAALDAAMADLSPGEGDGPDVVLIVVDGLRADALTPEVAPSLTAFAAGARRYTDVLAATPDAASGRASLLSGQHVARHGFFRNRRGSLPPRPPEVPALQERLSDAGWRTVGLAGDALRRTAGWHFERGFDVFLGDGLEASKDGLPYLRADRLTDLALAAAEATAGGPRFLWVEYLDPCVPWVAWSPWIDSPMDLVTYALWWPGRKKTGWLRRVREVMNNQRVLSPETRASWREVYEAEVSLADQEIGRLLEGLAERGIDEQDWIVVVGLMGQALSEHQLVGEGRDVYQTELAVPLLVRGPGVAAGADAAPLQTTDIAGMVLAGLGLEPPAPPQALRVAEVYNAPPAELRSAYGLRLKRERRAFIDGDHKLILDSAGPSEAYDLAADPDELTRVEDADWIEPLRERAGEWLADAPE